jgi:hypothetical protein
VDLAFANSSSKAPLPFPSLTTAPNSNKLARQRYNRQRYNEDGEDINQRETPHQDLLIGPNPTFGPSKGYSNNPSQSSSSQLIESGHQLSPEAENRTPKDPISQQARTTVAPPNVPLAPSISGSRGSKIRRKLVIVGDGDVGKTSLLMYARHPR